MAGRIVTNDVTGEKAWWDGQTLRPLSDNDINTGRAGPSGPVMTDTSADQKSLTEARDRARQSLNVAQKAEKFVGLNQKAGTGGLMGMVPWASEAMAKINPTLGMMESLNSAVAPGLRPPGSGSSSDKDTKTYKRAFPSLDYQGPTNQAIAKEWQGQSDKDNAYAAFADKWMAINGTLLGADKAFNDFWVKRQNKGSPARAGANTALKQKSQKARSGGFEILSVED